MQSTREFSSVSQAPTRCTDGAEGITKFRNSDSAAHMKYRTYSTSWCAGEEILLLKETYHLDKDLLMHHIMSATPLKRRRYNEPCSSSEGNILLCLVSLQSRSHSSEAFGVKEICLFRATMIFFRTKSANCPTCRPCSSASFPWELQLLLGLKYSYRQLQSSSSVTAAISITHNWFMLEAVIKVHYRQMGKWDLPTIEVLTISVAF